MASDISLNDQFIFVSNSRLFALVDFANEVGESIALTDEERSYVARFKEFSANAWPGIPLDLARAVSCNRRTEMVGARFSRRGATHLPPAAWESGKSEVATIDHR
jgi:hypothetical protein